MATTKPASKIEAEDAGEPCPHCKKTISMKWMMKEVSQNIVRLRVNLNGAPKVIYRCECGWVASAREMRQHGYPHKPPRGQECLASEADKEAYEKNGEGLLVK